MKTMEMLALLVIGVLALSYFGFITIPGLNLNGGTGIGTGGNDLTNTLDFVLIDHYAGTAQASKTINVYRGQVLQESCTTASDGSIETVNSYRSGEVLNIKIDEGSNEHWVVLTVPNHDAAKVEASDPTPVRLDGSDHPTCTDLVHDESGNAIADAGKLNYTLAGSTELITYTWFVGTDNTGLLASAANPLDGFTPQVVLYITFSDTNTHLNSGYDGSFLKGSTIVYYKMVSPDDVSKWKIGNNYVLDGSTSVSFEVDLTGATGTTATIQIDLYECDDPAYYRANYAHPPDATALCESTITLDNT